MTNAKSERITVRMTSQELARLESAAKLAGKSLEQFVLDAAIEEAEMVLEKSQKTCGEKN